MIGTLGNVGRVIGRRKFNTLIKNIDGKCGRIAEQRKQHKNE